MVSLLRCNSFMLYFIIIIGDKKHGEVKAIFDQTKSVTDKVKIIENTEQARKIKIPPKIGIISLLTEFVEKKKEEMDNA